MDQHLQHWQATLTTSSKGRNYSIIKENFALENYLLTLKKHEYLTLARLRTGNHHFPNETGRWQNIPIDNRKCLLCDIPDTPDEMHYLLKCPFFNEERKKYIKKYYYSRTNIIKYKQLMNTPSCKDLKSLCKFIKILLSVVR
jgi:hypothetical protein